MLLNSFEQVFLDQYPPIQHIPHCLQTGIPHKACYLLQLNTFYSLHHLSLLSPSPMYVLYNSLHSSNIFVKYLWQLPSGSILYNEVKHNNTSPVKVKEGWVLANEIYLKTSVHLLKSHFHQVYKTM